VTKTKKEYMKKYVIIMLLSLFKQSVEEGDEDLGWRGLWRKRWACRVAQGVMLSTVMEEGGHS